MNVNEITESLKEMFNEPLKDGENRKIVFWTDTNEEFKEDFKDIQIDGVKSIYLHHNNQFYVKYLLEEKDINSSYLIYTNMNIESPDNWLYDTVKYSMTFYADRVSLLLKEFNIDVSLRPYVEKYIAFFGAKDRRHRLRDFDITFQTREQLELAMMNVLCRKYTLDFQPVLRTVFMDTLEDEDNRYLHDFRRYFDVNTFWSYVEAEYAYDQENKSLKTLFMHLTITAFSQYVASKHLEHFKKYIADTHRTNIYVFIDQWMHHKDDYKIYDEYVQMVEEEIQLPNIIHELPVDTFKEADVFPYIDRAIIIYIANALLEQYEDYEEYISLIHERRNKHFYGQYKYIYDALYYTVKMYDFHKQFRDGIPQGRAKDIYQAYIDEYYVMDLYYRKFYVAYDKAENSDLLLKIKSHVENLYTNWYLADLSAHWTQSLQEEILDQWSLPGIYNQQQFYSNIVSMHENERVFVIISDALRYEIAAELKEQVRSEIMGHVEMDTLLGVVPSITKTGMAALLPQQSMKIDQKGRVLIDGKQTTNLKQREQILNAYVDESIAIDYEKVFHMNKAERRDTFRGKKLIYIYHDMIDAVGDDPRTEKRTFQAVEQSLKQLSNLLRIIRNDLSGIHVYITADHGFIYQRDALKVSDLMSKDDIDAFASSRRYMLSETKTEVSGQKCIPLSSVFDNDPPIYAYVPNATMRYRVQGGGANFVHGGVSLQEIVLPLLYIRNKRSGQRGAEAITKVDIRLTSTTRRITNSIFTLDFFQTERVAEQTNPRTVKVYMVDESDHILSNEEIIIGDSRAEDPKERMFTVQFALKNHSYDRRASYDLIIKDHETDIILERIPFTIHLGIISDFDF